MIVTNTSQIDECVQRPLYSFLEADELAQLSRGTAKRWLAGYRFFDSSGMLVREPAVARHRDAPPAKGVSFLGLLELVAVSGLRRMGFRIPEIRRIVKYSQRSLGTPYPFTSIALKHRGRDIFQKESPLPLAPRYQGVQVWNQALNPFIQTLDYEHDFARRWWPSGRSAGIVVDPDFGFGFPVIAGSGVRTEIILEQFETGESPEQIATDFNITVGQAQQAREFELSRRVA